RLSAVVVTLAVLVGVGWSYRGEKEQPAASPEAKVPLDEDKRDRPGDALPPGAVARLGSDRLRALTDSLHFAADGKTLVRIDGTLARTWDAATGKLLTVRSFPAGGDRRRAPSARTRDGNTWLLVTEDGTIEVWDVPSGKQVQLPVPEKRTRIKELA